MIRLLAETEPRFRPGNDLAHMTDWGGKLVGVIVLERWSDRAQCSIIQTHQNSMG